MEKLGDTLKKLNENGDFRERYEEMKQEILSNHDVREFIQAHEGEVTSSMIDRSLGKLYEYISQCKNCEHCSTLEGCKNIIPGFEPQLVLGRNAIDVHYVPCRNKLLEDERRKAASLIQCIHIPQEILKASLSGVTIDTPNRLKAVQKAEEYIENFSNEQFQKGFYLYGAFGTGKTYLLGVIANELAAKKVSSIIVYVPELIREMKQSITDHTVNEKLEMLKKAQVLMFDDIGAETVSSWVRDEILGPILQFRMLEKLPTFFTSNFDLKELEHHLAYTQRGEEEKVKAGRIIERIQFLAEPLLIDGSNKRLQKNSIGILLKWPSPPYIWKQEILIGGIGSDEDIFSKSR